MRYSKKIISAVLGFTAGYVVVRLLIVALTGYSEFTSLDALVGSVTGIEGGILGALKYKERKENNNDVL